MHKTILTTLGSALLLTAGFVQAQILRLLPLPCPQPRKRFHGAPAPAVTVKVARAQFTTAVSHREPADEVTTLDSSHDKVFFFTALNDAAGQTVTHRWEFNGKTVAEVKFAPKADHWRVWSSKTLMPDQTGTWTVEVVDGSGNTLTSKSFDYTQRTDAACSRHKNSRACG